MARSRNIFPVPSVRHPGCSYPRWQDQLEYKWDFMVGAGRKEESTLESLHFFCDLDHVLLLSCHSTGCVFLSVADLRLLFCLS